MKTTLILSSIFTHFNSRNKYTNKQKKLYHKTRLFTHFFLPHSTGNLGYHNFFISFIHIYLCSHILFFLEFSPIQQIKQAHVFLFLGVNMKKIRLAQCTSLRQLAIVLFQRRWLYRLLYQSVYKFAFFLFLCLFSTYMTRFLLILLVYLYIWQRTQ